MSVGGVSPQAGEESHSGGLKKKGLSGEDRPEDQGTGHRAGHTGVYICDYYNRLVKLTPFISPPIVHSFTAFK